MLRISRLSDYAVLLLQRLIQAEGGGLSASELARMTSVSYPTVSKVLKQLADAHVVVSQRGVKGGYRLAKPADQLSL